MADDELAKLRAQLASLQGGSSVAAAAAPAPSTQDAELLKLKMQLEQLQSGSVTASSTQKAPTMSTQDAEIAKLKAQLAQTQSASVSASKAATMSAQDAEIAKLKAQLAQTQSASKVATVSAQDAEIEKLKAQLAQTQAATQKAATVSAQDAEIAKLKAQLAQTQSGTKTATVSTQDAEIAKLKAQLAQTQSGQAQTKSAQSVALDAQLEQLRAELAKKTAAASVIPGTQPPSYSQVASPTIDAKNAQIEALRKQLSGMNTGMSVSGSKTPELLALEQELAKARQQASMSQQATQDTVLRNLQVQVQQAGNFSPTQSASIARKEEEAAKLQEEIAKLSKQAQVIKAANSEMKKRKSALKYHVVFIIDSSGSMGASDVTPQGAYRERFNNRLGAVFEAVEAFIKHQLSFVNCEDTVSMVVFSDSARELFVNEPMTKAGLLNNVQGYEWSGTSFAAGLDKGWYCVSQSKANYVPIIIFLSDGQASDTSDALSKLSQIVNQYRANQIQVHTMGFGTGQDFSLLERMAREGNGQFHTVGLKLTDLMTTFSSMSKSLSVARQ